MSVKDHRPLEYLFNSWFRRVTSNKISKLCITDPLWGNPPVTGGFPSQRASNAESVSMWRHHGQFHGISAQPRTCHALAMYSQNQSCVISDLPIHMFHIKIWRITCSRFYPTFSYRRVKHAKPFITDLYNWLPQKMLTICWYSSEMWTIVS